MQCRVAKVLALRFFILQIDISNWRAAPSLPWSGPSPSGRPLRAGGVSSTGRADPWAIPSSSACGEQAPARALRRGRGAQRSPGKGRHHGLPARAHGRRGSRGGETGGLRRPAAAGPLPSLRRHSWRTAVCRHWALRPGAQGTAPGLPAEPDERTSAPLEQNLALKRACRSARRAWHLQPTRKDMELEVPKTRSLSERHVSPGPPPNNSQKPPGAPERPPGGLQDPRVRPRRRTPPAGPQGPCPSSSVIRIQAGLHEAPKETPRDTVDSRSVGARKSRRPRRPFNRTERGPDCATLNSVGSSGVAVSLGGSASQECNLERLRQRRRRSNAA
ncbi:unnamed protein product [Prorocentrum cordatum]|uniref:Uncharacterized protein n=1 Tax=Prorocentrum cordatum TaxID=2364126 RepID=A0ABN9WFJ8_9DINO|nr:unnamed protein product [Polarella glacialis]